jgi:hypothetical protein
MRSEVESQPLTQGLSSWGAKTLGTRLVESLPFLQNVSKLDFSFSKFYEIFTERKFMKRQ